MTSIPQAPSADLRRTSAAPIRGWGKLAALNLRSWAVLAVGNLLAGFVVAIAAGGAMGTGFLIVLVLALPIAGAVIWLVGYPAGVLTAHLLTRSESENVHVLTFAAVGAVLSTALLAIVSRDPVVLGVAALEGALGAGLARLWSGHAHRRGARVPELGYFDASGPGAISPYAAATQPRDVSHD